MITPGGRPVSDNERGKTRINMASNCRIVFLLLFASAMLCSVTCDESRSYSPYHVLFYASQSAKSSVHHVMRKRATLSGDAAAVPPEVIVCNNLQSQATWTCTCHGCKDNQRPPCCLESVDHVILNQSVVVVFNGSDYSYADDVRQIEVKKSLSEAISDYCENNGGECLAAMSTSGVGVTNTSGLFSFEQIVFVELVMSSLIDDDGSGQIRISITLFVLQPRTLAADSITTMYPSVSAMPGYLIQKALTTERDVLEKRLAVTLLSVREPTWTDDNEPQTELPVKAIVAGSVLGFFLAFSCIVSAVKAVRDRRLIKERNSAKRERRRQQELRDSIRRSPLKQKLDEYAVKASPERNTSNGDVRTPSISSQVIRVVVHDGNEALNGRMSPNGKPVFPDDHVTPNSVVTHGEIHVPPPNAVVGDDASTQNGNVIDDGGETSAKMAAGRQATASDALLQKTPDGDSSESVADAGPLTRSTTSIHSAVDAEVSVENQHLSANHVTPGNYENVSLPEVSAGQQTGRQKPGLINPAYDGE